MLAERAEGVIQVDGLVGGIDHWRVLPDEGLHVEKEHSGNLAVSPLSVPWRGCYGHYAVCPVDAWRVRFSDGEQGYDG